MAVGAVQRPPRAYARIRMLEPGSYICTVRMKCGRGRNEVVHLIRGAPYRPPGGGHPMDEISDYSNDDSNDEQVPDGPADGPDVPATDDQEPPEPEVPNSPQYTTDEDDEYTDYQTDNSSDPDYDTDIDGDAGSDED